MAKFPLPYLMYLFIILLPLFSFFLISASSLTPNEIKRIKKLSITQLKPITDVSNKYLNNPSAILLGESLFSDKRLSSNKKVSCATCHVKENAFTDNKNIAIGLQKGYRNTPTLLNAPHHNWFFADGRKDSLWSQVLSSIENPSEHNFTRIELLRLFHQDQNYQNIYKSTFKVTPPFYTDTRFTIKRGGPNSDLSGLIEWKKINRHQQLKINKFFTNIGKSIAAYVSTITTQPSKLDKYIEQISLSNHSPKFKKFELNSSEIKGYKLFISPKSGCSNCHSGPLFSNKEFHNVGTGIKGKDNGRSEVIEAVVHDEFNCLSKFSDAKPEQCLELNYINRNKHSLSGAFKTSSLRNLSKTAPYMHDGRFSTLEEVLNYYSNIDIVKTKSLDLSPISLTQQEQQDIISFLLTL